MEADDVGLEDVLEEVAVAVDVASEMDDGVDVADGGVHSIQVGEVGDVVVVARFDDGGVVGVVRIEGNTVEATDAVAGGVEFGDDFAADPAGGAGDEDVFWVGWHGLLFGNSFTRQVATLNSFGFVGFPEFDGFGGADVEGGEFEGGGGVEFVLVTQRFCGMPDVEAGGLGGEVMLRGWVIEDGATDEEGGVGVLVFEFGTELVDGVEIAGEGFGE